MMLLNTVRGDFEQRWFSTAHFCPRHGGPLREVRDGKRGSRGRQNRRRTQEKRGAVP